MGRGVNTTTVPWIRGAMFFGVERWGSLAGVAISAVSCWVVTSLAGAWRAFSARGTLWAFDREWFNNRYRCGFAQ